MTGSAVVGFFRRPWSILGVAAVLLVGGGALAASFVIPSTAGAAGGVQSNTAFLTHWQQTAVTSAATPAPVPALLSSTAGAPTRLPGVVTSFRLNAAVAGDQAVEWTFTETVGIPVNQEVEIAFTVQYSVGAVAHSATLTTFVESQAAALPATLTFQIYWDSGAAAGITFVAETEISQGCAAVGSCP